VNFTAAAAMLRPHTRHLSHKNLPPDWAGYQLIAKKYMKKGVFPVFGIGVAD